MRALAAALVLVLLSGSSFPGHQAEHAASAGSVRGPIISANDETVVLTQNQLLLTVANYGTFGNLFVSRASSLEYPRTSGYEHLTDAGVWIGAKTRDGSGVFTGVSTATEDAALGSSTASKTEFTPSVPSFMRRSTNLASPWYSPLAVSELDLICSYSDTPARNGTSEPSRPLRVAVQQSVYNWNTIQLRDVVFVRDVIVAQGDTLRDVWVGQFAEMASGNKNGYVNWPPSSTDPSGLGGWFSKKLVVYEPAQRLVREHYCRNQPVPAGCAFEIAPPWIGLELLTPPRAGQSVTVAAWPWGPSMPPHNTDVGRYSLISAGTIADFTSPSLAPSTGDPVEVLAVGPFSVVAPGDSVIVDFAWVGGADDSSILAHARSAQAVRDAGFNPAVLAVPESGDALELRINGVEPNPSRGDAVRVVFQLPSAAPVTAELFDLAGRRVLGRRWSNLGPGAHALEIVAPATLAPGVYLVRLCSGGRAAMARVVLVE